MFSKKKSTLIFLAPGLLLLMVFYFVPFIGGMSYSFMDGTINNEFVGFENYVKLWKNKMFQLGLRNTLELSLICAPLLWLLSFILAVFLSEIRENHDCIRSCVLLPYLIPSSAMLSVWLLIFDYGGPINRCFELLALNRIMWLESAALRVPIILMFIWKNLGFSLIIFSASLQTIPSSYYEYARLEGAGFLTRVFRITLPLIAPNAYLVFVLAWINSFKIFKEVYFIAGAYPDYSVYTLQNYMNNMFAKLDYQNVTAAAYSFAAIVLLLFGLLFLLQRKATDSLN